MIVFPAIDIRNGKCVRLYKGEFSKSTVVAQDPVKAAIDFKVQGAQYLHIVDLDGALNGNMENADIVGRIVKETGIQVQAGGGIRDLPAIERLIEKGADRVIIGTAALSNPSMVKEAANNFGDRIAVGIDARDGLVAVEGWVNTSSVPYIEFAKKIEDMGIRTIIFTDISRDGTLSGPNFNQIAKLDQEVSCSIIAAGGIKNIIDIKKLKDMDLYGAIIGKALYSGDISLNAAIETARGDENAY